MVIAFFFSVTVGALKTIFSIFSLSLHWSHKNSLTHLYKVVDDMISHSLRILYIQQSLLWSVYHTLTRDDEYSLPQISPQI